MSRINHFYETIPGWFNFQRLYSEMVTRFPSGSRFLEIGTYAGRSFSYLAVEVVNSGKQIELHGLDGFGWPGEASFQSFMHNMEPIVNAAPNQVMMIHKGNSVDLSKRFEDGYFDFVFIDANHEYEAVKADITAYLPKVKPGGVLAGHDYHPVEHEVKRAVDELFAPGTFRVDSDSSCWIVEINDL